MDPEEQKQRLDLLMVQRKLAPTRSKARDLIKSGHVSVNGVVSKKAGHILPAEVTIKLALEAPQFVSRAALKLSHAITHFGVECQDRVVLDLGASTGGFTEVLLQKKAAYVYAIDVGHDQLHNDLRRHPNVTSMEGQDARLLKRDQLQHKITAITVDVSFISLMKILETPMNLAEHGSWMVALVKPQFEVGRKALGKKGIVKDQQAIKSAIDAVIGWLETKPGWQVRGTTPSPITGQTGNQEYLLHAVKSEVSSNRIS